jgi:hypothetical protein
MMHFNRLRCAILFAVLIMPVSVSPASAAEAPGHAASPPPVGYSAATLFNQANALARQGHTGQAVLHYEQALLLAPNDADSAANLQAVRAKAGLPEVTRSTLACDLTLLRPNTMAWLGCGGLLLAGVGGLLVRLLPARRGSLHCLVWAGALLVAGTAGNACMLWPRVHEAVVIARTAPARNAPVATGNTAFTLREGETISVLAERQDFLLVQTPAGRSGWVERREIARVVPVTGDSLPLAHQT